MAERVRREHQWIQRPELPWETCAVCGIIRRRDDKNGASCRGYVKVGPRLSAHAKGASDERDDT